MQVSYMLLVTEICKPTHNFDVFPKIAEYIYDN